MYVYYLELARVDGETRKISKNINICVFVRARVCMLTRIVRSLFFYVYIRDPTGKSKQKKKKKKGRPEATGVVA